MPETPDFGRIAHHIVDVAYTDDGQTARDVKAALRAGIAAQLRVRLERPRRRRPRHDRNRAHRPDGRDGGRTRDQAARSRGATVGPVTRERAALEARGIAP
jgi:hypothetical protein